MEVVSKGEGKIGDIKLLTDMQHRLLTDDFNNTSVDYPANETIIDLFENQVNRNPDAIALIFEDEQFTYRELNRQSNQLARYLKRKGVTAETLVPVCVERNSQMIVALIAILKSGAKVPVSKSGYAKLRSVLGL